MHPGGATDQNWKSENVQKNYLPPTLEIFFSKIYIVLKVLFQHIKNLAPHFLISESYRKNGFFTALQRQILEFDLF